MALAFAHVVVSFRLRSMVSQQCPRENFMMDFFAYDDVVYFLRLVTSY
jgi:hypothetical protein